MEFVTKIPWVTKVKTTHYGSDTTYRLAAEWLKHCKEVADWGGGRGYFYGFLPMSTDYRLIDGTADPLAVRDVTLRDLSQYRAPHEGILLRHVLEMTEDWAKILENAVTSFTKRMVVVTFTPRVKETKLAKHHLTWPVFHFNHDVDLIPRMQPHLVDQLDVRTSWHNLPERVYFLEKK
jgi:hypothetical protein